MSAPDSTDRTRLRRLKNTPPLPRGLAASEKHRRLTPHAGLPQVALPPGRVRGKYPDVARLLCQRAKNTQQQTLGGWWAVSMLRFLPRRTVGTCRNLQHSQKSHAKTPRVQSRCGLRHETCDPGATTDPHRTHRFAIQAGRFFHHHCCHRTQCAWKCARQLAEAQHKRQLLAKQKSVQRTLPRRNGQQMSAKSLQRWWKQQIGPPPRRRAAMARASLPNPQAEWLFAGIMRHVSLTVDPSPCRLRN